MSDTLVINEIYLSLQGESTLAGLPCLLIRLTGCDLRCSYCDTAYAFKEGQRRSLEEIRAEVHQTAARFSPPTSTSKVQALDGRVLRLPLVELTGGEPLLQPNSTRLLRWLCDDGFTVLLETSGAHDISAGDSRVRRIVDLKCPSSGEAERNRWENLSHLTSNDELKFAIGTPQDYEWAKQVIYEHDLALKCPVLMSWVHPLGETQRDKSLKPVPPDHEHIARQELADRIVADGLPVRFQLQMHKIIWSPEQRGV